MMNILNLLEGKNMNKLNLLGAVCICLLSINANASMIITTSGDDSIVEAILGFDAGPLGIVDIDFGGNTFDLAFGTDPVPADFLFASSKPEALAFITNIAAELNLYNASAATNADSVDNVIEGAGTDIVSYINVAYDVTATSNGVWQINYSTSGGWSDPSGGDIFSRDTSNFTYARMTAASVVPIPAAAWLFSSGLLGLIGMARRKDRV